MSARVPPMIPVPGITGAAEQTRIVNDNFRKLHDLLARAILAGDLVGALSVTEAMLTLGARTLAGPDVTGLTGASGSTALSANAKTLLGDVTGTTGSAGATVVERLRGKNLPAPVAGDDLKVIQYVHGAPGSFGFVALPAGGAGAAAVQRNRTADLTLADGESLVVAGYLSFSGTFALILQGDSVAKIL